MNLFSLFHHDSKQAEAHAEVTGSSHKAKLSHELIAGAVAYGAGKLYERHVQANGKPDSHAKAKELLCGFVAVATTHVLETKGLGYFDKKKTEEEASKQAEEALAKHYG
ncbi:hypothetical protein AX14_001427 [Amanita brunnescens Koide BX004]|nr:hypothetical protein AX14_001427 [Amanita brunnescens Koide BX004]